METGKVRWQADLPFPGQMNMDSSTITVFDGVVLGAQMDGTPGYTGNNRVWGMSAVDGKQLWTYSIQNVVWNFLPSTPGDGTVLFSTTHARAHRLNLSTGELIWKSGGVDTPFMFGTGGGVVGPNG